MSKVSFSTLAYCKIVAHAAKYPHCEVNGLLIAETTAKSDTLVIVDSVPLFHQCLHVSPMSEIALTQTDQSAITCDMYIAGYYLANETLDDLRWIPLRLTFVVLTSPRTHGITYVKVVSLYNKISLRRTNKRVPK